MFIHNAKFEGNVHGVVVQANIYVFESTGSPADVLITDSIIYGKGSEYDGTGVINNCSDNYLNNVRIYGFRKGFEINAYCSIDNTHVLLRWAEQTTENFDPYPVGSPLFVEYYEQTMFAEVNSECKIIFSYADSVYNFLNITTSSYVICTNSFYYNARTGIDQRIIECLKRDTKLTLTDCEFALKQGTNVSILRCTDSTNPTFSGYAQLTISGIEISGISKLTNSFDLALSGYPIYTHGNISGSSNTWYIAGAVANVTNNTNIDGYVFINGWNYAIKIDCNTNNTGALVRQYSDSETATNYTVGVVYDETNHIALICIKSSNALSNVKLDFKMNNATNFAIQLSPVKGDSMFGSTRLLSDYTALTPAKSLVLNQAVNIRTAS